MVDKINTDDHGHIMTIEDPVEFLHEHKNCVVNQREVGADTQSFKKALKSILRQDPDVVLVGELRDLETIEAALTIAETGHVCFGTLHTNGCVSTINRIIDAFPAYQQPQIRAQLSMVLEGVLSQSLVPKPSGGRAMVLEVMIPTPAIRNLIREDKIHQIYSQMQLGQAKHGMQTANQCSGLARGEEADHDGAGGRVQLRSRGAEEHDREPADRRCRPDNGRRRGKLWHTFAWEGRTRAGEVRKGTMDAEAEPEVANRLRSQGITLSKAKKKAKDIEIKLPFGWGQGVPEKDLVVFTRQFATMIDAGLPIVQCLDILATQSPNKNFQKMLCDVKAQVEQGSTFSDALKKHPRCSTSSTRTSCRRARSAASSTPSCTRLALYIEKAMKLKSQVKGAMVYPISILIVAILVVIVLLVEGHPRLRKHVQGLRRRRAAQADADRHQLLERVRRPLLPHHGHARRPSSSAFQRRCEQRRAARCSTSSS